MKVELKQKYGIILNTKDKYVREDITITLDDKSYANLTPGNIKAGLTILGIEGMLGEGIPEYGTSISIDNGNLKIISSE